MLFPSSVLQLCGLQIKFILRFFYPFLLVKSSPSQIIDFHYWWQIFSILILLVTLCVTLIVFLGSSSHTSPLFSLFIRCSYRETDHRVLEQKKSMTIILIISLILSLQIIVSYGVYLIFIVISAANQTWSVSFSHFIHEFNLKDSILRDGYS